MLKLSIRLFFILLVFNLILPSCDAFRNRGYGTKAKNIDTAKQGAPMGTGMAAQTPSTSTARRGLGISAWGLVTLIISIILAMAGLYYFSICYPVLCKKTRKYDMIGLSTVA